jgi:hypothetical protein
MQVFICYAREDRDDALALYDSLKVISRVSPWLDKKNLLAGEDWDNAIINAIDESQLFILLLSRNSVAKTGYIQKEIGQALNRLKSYPSGKFSLIPARLDESEPNHEELHKLERVDLFPDWNQGIAGIAKSITKAQRKREGNVHFLIDNRLIHNVRQLFGAQNMAVQTPLNDDKTMSLFQFIEDLVLFDKIVVNSTVEKNIFKGNADFLRHLEEPFGNPEDLFVFEGFSGRLDIAGQRAIVETLNMFKEPDITLIKDLYNEIDHTHKQGIKESYDFIKEVEHRGLRDIRARIGQKQKEVFYGRNFFISLYADGHESVFQNLSGIRELAKDDFVAVLTAMFVYFSFSLNSELGNSGDFRGYSPITNRESFVRKMLQSKNVDQIPSQRRFLRHAHRQIQDAVYKISDRSRIRLQKKEVPLFGFTVYESAKKKDIDHIMGETFHIRLEAQKYRDWLHGINPADEDDAVREEELQETLHLLERFNLKTTREKAEMLTSVNDDEPAEERYVFLSNMVKRLCSIE